MSYTGLGASGNMTNGSAFANTSLLMGTIVFAEYADSGTLADTITGSATTGGQERFMDERNSTSESFWVNATYDAASDNALELAYNSSLTTNFNFGWKNLNADDDDNKKTITYKGTIITIDDDNSKQSIVIEHPKVASYARVFVAPVAASTTVSAEGTYTSEIQQIGVNQFKLDTEVADATAVNVVAVGGPCANSVVAALMGNPAECYSAMGIEAGQGLIKLFEDATTGKVALVVAGQTAEDTRLSSQVVANYAEYDLSGDELIAVTVNAADLKVITREEAAATAAEAEEEAAPVEEAEEPAAEEATE